MCQSRADTLKENPKSVESKMYLNTFEVIRVKNDPSDTIPLIFQLFLRIHIGDEIEN